ncbi:ATP-binding protein [Streptomyces sp. MS1.AVA.1]|uniref:ATP-binding protein n=1 Tax=Streptomyces machairae TaxID=3134109 RepID=A0ABU8UGQ3_9ACTN
MPETYTDVLIGRQDEIRRLDALLQAARQGMGGALVLRGEPGIGKSVLLRHLDEAATGFLVMRASGRSSRWSCRTPRCTSCSPRHRPG